LLACLGKRNVCEALVVEVQALKCASETVGTIAGIDDLMAAWKTKEEKGLKRVEEGAEEGTGEL